MENTLVQYGAATDLRRVSCGPIGKLHIRELFIATIQGQKKKWFHNIGCAKVYSSACSTN